MAPKLHRLSCSLNSSEVAMSNIWARLILALAILMSLAGEGVHAAPPDTTTEIPTMMYEQLKTTIMTEIGGRQVPVQVLGVGATRFLAKPNTSGSVRRA